MKYQLIASDFDDTLLPPSMQISEYTINTINRYLKMGGRFVICTGRMYDSIKKEAKKIGLHGDAITYQGALIKNLDTDKTLFSNGIAPDLAVEYIKSVKKFSEVIHLYIDDKLYIEKENPYSTTYGNFCGVTPRPVGDLCDFVLNNDKTIYKCLFFVTEQNNEYVRNFLADNFKGRLLVNSSKPWNIEAVDVGVSKGKAIKAIADLYGLPLESVMAFGDNLNDLDMIETAGFGVAVGNAVQTLKDKADYISDDCSDDGVAHAIDKFCLGD